MIPFIVNLNLERTNIVTDTINWGYTFDLPFDASFVHVTFTPSGNNVIAHRYRDININCANTKTASLYFFDAITGTILNKIV